LWAQWTLLCVCTKFPFEEREREHVCVVVLEKAIVFTRIGQAVVKLNIIAGGDLDPLVKSLPNIF
jgi:hypothetical protein